jgi:alkylresorcinol/alkylpyrone synthase
MAEVALAGLGTAVPEHRLPQTQAAALAREFFGERFADFDRLAPVFVNSGIDSRALAMPVEWYLEPRGFEARNAAYLEVATSLFEKSAADALERAGLHGRDIDAVVTVTSSGVATPTLDARAAHRLGLRSDVMRVPMFGLGCAGGLSGLSVGARLAARSAGAESGAKVLVVAVELCTLSFRRDTFTKANVVATALFADGAAAAVLVPAVGGSAVTLTAGCQHMWPSTLRIMGWDVADDGFEVVFDRDIPPFIRRQLRPVADGALERLGIERADVERFGFHPGGAKVLEAIEGAMELPPGSLDIERAVLRANGNMSAPTVLFVLERLLASGGAGLRVMSALGPGFTAVMVPVRSQ